jgi:hypothetical protein
MAGDNDKRTRNGDDDSPSPRNLIREPWRQDRDDPPNLHRLSTRQTIEQHGVAELYERFAGAGAHTPVQNAPAAPGPRPRRRGRTLKRRSAVEK